MVLSESNANNVDTITDHPSFDPSTHNWDDGEWVEIECRKKGNRNTLKPVSYSDILSKPVKELEPPKVSKGFVDGKRCQNLAFFS